MNQSNYKLSSHFASCPLCGSNTNIITAQQSDIFYNLSKTIYSVYTCTHCDHSFLDSVEDIDMSSYYNCAYAFHRNYAFLRIRSLVDYIVEFFYQYLPFLLLPFQLSPSLSRLIISRVVYDKPQDPVRYWLNTHRPSNKSLKFLDFGSVNGQSSHIWSAKGSLSTYSSQVSSFGYDPFLPSAVHTSKYSIFNDPNNLYKISPFDFIRLNWSLEHIPDLHSTLKLISEISSTNTKVLVCVPNYHTFLRILNPNLVELPVHCHHFSLKSLRFLFSSYGFEYVYHHTFSSAASIDWSARNNLIDLPNYSNFYSYLFTLPSILSFFHSQDMGNELIVLFQRRSS